MGLSKIEIKFLEEEYIKCKNDISYFSENYCKILDKDQNRMVNFELYPFQKTTFKILQKNDKAIILKARQMGITAICVLLSLHSMIFNDNYKIVVVSNRQNTSNDFVTKIKEMFNELPEFLKGNDEFRVNNQKKFELSSGSSIVACSSNPDNARSLPSNLIIFDEMAFCNNAEEVWKAVSPTLAKNGKIIMLSTPNSANGYFYNYWTLAEKSKNGFIPIKLKYDLHPKYDEKWASDMTQEMGERAFNQEFCCEFGNSGDGVFVKTDIEYFELNTVREPLYMYGNVNESWVFEEPLYDQQYCVLVDTALGNGKDSSTIQVFKLGNSEQVLEVESYYDPKQLAFESISLALKYNKAILIIESTGIGSATTGEADYIGYENLYKTGRGDIHNFDDYMNNYGNEKQTGFPMTHSSRPVAISKFIRDIETQSLILRSRRTVNELKNFVWIRGKAQASYGSNDDLIMPISMYSYLKDTVLVYANRTRRLDETMLNSIQFYRPNVQNYNTHKSNHINLLKQYDLEEYNIFN
jgi:hypothetical protein